MDDLIFKIDEFVEKRKTKKIEERNAVAQTILQLKEGQSFFVPDRTLSSQTIRGILKELREEGNIEEWKMSMLVRVNPIKGTRICRYRS